MGGYSCIQCKKKRSQDSDEIYHHFPLDREEVCWLWVFAAKLSNYPTKNQFLCSDHFKPEDYKYPNSSILNHDAVPSIFDCSGSSCDGRKPPKKRELPAEDNQIRKKPRNEELQVVPVTESLLQNVPYSKPSPTKEELRTKIEDMNKKLKTKACRNKFCGYLIFFQIICIILN